MTTEEYHFNPEVEVGNERTIAARGLTPEHIGKSFVAYNGYYSGKIVKYQHVPDENASYVFYESVMRRVEQVKFATLDLLTVTD